MMKKGFLKSVLGLVLVTLLLGFVTTNAFADTNPKDVLASHWAYQAVKLLLDKGYLQLYQDQTFQGEQPVDRYTLATVVAKILQEVGSGKVATNRDDVKLMRSLTNEFREELVKVLTENSSLAKQLEDLNRQDQIFKEDLTKLNLTVQDLSEEQQALQQEVQSIIAELVVLKNKVAQLETDVEALKKENKRQTLYIIIAFVLGLASK